MKYAILAIALFIASCSAMIIPEKNLKMPNVESLYEAEMWIWDNIHYEWDKQVEGKPDHWKTPYETLRDGYGDCEDKALLFLEICIVNELGEGYFVLSYVPDQNAGHAYAKVGDYIFGNIDGQIDVYSMTYREALALAGYL